MVRPVSISGRTRRAWLGGLPQRSGHRAPPAAMSRRRRAPAGSRPVEAAGEFAQHLLHLARHVAARREGADHDVATRRHRVEQRRVVHGPGDVLDAVDRRSVAVRLTAVTW